MLEILLYPPERHCTAGGTFLYGYVPETNKNLKDPDFKALQLVSKGDGPPKHLEDQGA